MDSKQLQESINEFNRKDAEFFTEAFKNSVTGESCNVPLGIKNAAMRLCRSYGIRGICDPMYFANIIALELGLGDGQGSFNQ